MKSITLTIKEVSDIDIGLSLIINQKLPITPSWRFGQWKKGTGKVMKDVEERRNKLIQEYGAAKGDGSIEVTAENKQKYYEDYKLLMNEPVSMEVPEVPASLLKDVQLTTRFATLVGHHLINDITNQKVEGRNDLSNQQLLDLDMAISLIMDEQLPSALALKLGEMKRKAEAFSAMLREKNDQLVKEHGEVNSEFNYEVTDPAKMAIIEDAIGKWLEEKAGPVNIPMVNVSELEGKDLMLPSRFFMLSSPFVA